MNRIEALDFYFTKQQRARSLQIRCAYEVIRDLLRVKKTMRGVRLALADLSTDPTPPTQRAIYRRALREMEV